MDTDIITIIIMAQVVQPPSTTSIISYRWWRWCKQQQYGFFVFSPLVEHELHILAT